MSDASMLLQRLQRMCMVHSVDILPRGHVRLETGFTYPDGAAGRAEQRLALIDDMAGATEAYRDDDLRRIQSYATVVPFSERDTLQSLLAA